jgi:hypothetical protein
MENAKMIFESLYSHSLVNIALQKAVGITNSLVVNRPVEVEAKYSRELNEYEYYVITVGHTLAHLLGNCQQMMYAVHFLSTFKPTKQTKESQINRSDYIQ